MGIRSKFALATAVLILSIAALGASAIWAVREAAAIQATATTGLRAVADLRKMYGALKDLLISSHLPVAVDSWLRAFELYTQSLDSFVRSPRLQAYLRDPEFKESYERTVALVDHNKDRLTNIYLQLQQFRQTGILGDRGLLIQAFIDRREDIFPLYDSVNSVAVFFSDVFESSADFLIATLQRATVDLQRNVITVFVISLAIIGLSVTALAGFFSRSLIKRILSVEQAVRLLSTGDLSHKLRIDSKDEFGTLAKNYNEFMAEFKARVDSELDFIRHVRETVTNEIDIKQVYRIIVQSSVRNTYADAGALFIVDGTDKRVRPESVEGFFPPLTHHGGETDEAALEEVFLRSSFALGETIIGEVAAAGHPVYIPDSTMDRRLPSSDNGSAAGIHSFVAVPLVVGGRILGVLAVVKRRTGSVFTDMDYTHMRTFADYAALMLDYLVRYLEILEKREIEHDISIASDIQKRLLPARLPEIPGVAVAAFSASARGVTGDYFDVIKLDNDRIACVMCDVAGKGVAASLVMVMVRSILHLIIRQAKGTAALLRWINLGVTDQVSIDRFVTIGLFVYNSTLKEVMYSNAAHLPLLWYSAKEDRFVEVDTEGLPIGIERKSTYGEEHFPVGPGDILVLYTDGVVEALSEKGTMYGLETLKSLVGANRTRTAKQISDTLKADLARFVGNARRHDDQSLVVLKLN